MRRLIRPLIALGILTALVTVVGVILFLSTYPDVEPPEDLTIETTPERIARGAYLANHVSVCMDCHSTRDRDYYSGPIVPGTEGKGGERFGPDTGLPGTFYASNITSAHIGHWTDGEIVRAITSGVSRDGTPLFPVMPYPAYNGMTTQDVHAIVAYMRTLRPIPSNVPERKMDFPMNLVVRTMPMRYEPESPPDPSAPVAYGAYMTRIAGCADCHTPQDSGVNIPGMEFAGGFEFPLPTGGMVRSSNITPDQETGIGTWTKKMFIDRFKQYESARMRRMPVQEGDRNTIMSWTMYAGMTEEDLGAVFTYLRTVAPVSNAVEIHPAR